MQEYAYITGEEGQLLARAAQKSVLLAAVPVGSFIISVTGALSVECITMPAAANFRVRARGVTSEKQLRGKKYERTLRIRYSIRGREGLFVSAVCGPPRTFSSAKLPA